MAVSDSDLKQVWLFSAGSNADAPTASVHFMIQALGGCVSKFMFSKILSDVGAGATVNFDLFSKVCSDSRIKFGAANDRGDLLKIFQCIDSEGVGKVSVENFKAIMSGYVSHLDDKEYTNYSSPNSPKLSVADLAENALASVIREQGEQVRENGVDYGKFVDFLIVQLR